MLIDFHVHLADTVPIGTLKRLEISVHQLIDRMNREGIDRTVLLPLESPEAISGYYLTRDALRDFATYPERLIPFVSIDPRMPGLKDLIALYEKRGCIGFGELKNGLAFDDPLNKAIYAECDARGWACVFHSDPTLCWDEVGLPRLEACLKEFPNCQFVAHGPGWWAALSGDDQRKGGYPKGKIAPGGAADRLLGEYPNLWADLSAGSGHNGLTRDPEFTIGFIERHWPKMLFATDLMYCGQELPQVKWLAHDAPVTEEQRAAIAGGNALRLLGLNG
jgi:predicted TIM-barrel fold metal-dependent hydrolase